MKKINCVGDDKYKYLLKNIVLFGVGLFGAKFVQFLLLPYFTNVLSPSEYGIIDMVVSFVGLMVPIVSLELSDSILRYGLSDTTDKSALLKNSALILTFAAILTVLLSPLMVFYKTLYPWSRFIIFLIITQCLRTNLALFIKADNKVLLYSLDSVVTALDVAILDIFFISYLNIGLNGYFYAEIIGNIFSIGILFLGGRIYKYWDKNKKIDFSLLKQMLKYSIPLMFNAISWWITSFSDRVVLNYYFSSGEVGIYSVAAKLPAIITTLLSVFTQAWIMSAVKEYEKKSNPSFFRKVYASYSAILFAGVSLAILVVKPIMKIYVGSNFYEAWYYTPILLIGTIFLGISNYYGAIYAAAKANLLEIKSTVICAASNMIFNIILIPKLSILGAVIATMMSYVIVVIVRIIDVKKIMSFRVNSINLFWRFGILLMESFAIMTGRLLIAVGGFVLTLICVTYGWIKNENVNF